MPTGTLGTVMACCLLLAPLDRQQANARRANLPSRPAMTCVGMHSNAPKGDRTIQKTQHCTRHSEGIAANTEQALQYWQTVDQYQSTPTHDFDDTLTVITRPGTESYIKVVPPARRGGGGCVQRMIEPSDATCTERTWLVLTDVVAAKVLARLSSNASTASLLSFRFTMSSSGTGTNGSSVSATTCTSRLALFALCSDRDGACYAVCEHHFSTT